jgi:hypothetical protein
MVMRHCFENTRCRLLSIPPDARISVDEGFRGVFSQNAVLGDSDHEPCIHGAEGAAGDDS